MVPTLFEDDFVLTLRVLVIKNFIWNLDIRVFEAVKTIWNLELSALLIACLKSNLPDKTSDIFCLIMNCAVTVFIGTSVLISNLVVSVSNIACLRLNIFVRFLDN